jgi:hypothetical protein
MDSLACAATEYKSFPIAAILSLTTGKLLCQFSDMHELAEWIAGHPIWTHEFADKLRWNSLKDAVLSQHPDLSSADASKVGASNWQEFVASSIAKYGDSRVITKGGQQRTETPLQSLERIAPGKPVVVVKSKP